MGLSYSVLAQPGPLPENPGHYTTEQADRGEALYAGTCVVCHGENLNDGEFGAPLKGSSFSIRWAGINMEAFFDATREMPPGQANSLSRQQYTDLMAYILQENDVTASEDSLPTDSSMLATLFVPGNSQNSAQAVRRSGGPAGGFAPGVVIPEWESAPNPLESISNVTESLLATPPAESWLNWRGTYDAMGYSPLDQINKDNVSDLRVAWSLALPPGPNEATPLIHEGVMFVHSFGDNVMALNAVTGDELWHYRHELAEDARPSVKRNIAIYGDKVYAGTSDGKVIALDMRTGALAWETDIGGAITGGPMVAKGVVMQGTLMTRQPNITPGGGFIQALDAETGEKIWRFNSIPEPDELGGNSWNGVPYDERNGGSFWTTGSYDPENNLAYFAPSPTYDTAQTVNPVNQPGITNDALFTNSTLALRPETGELVWYFQHMNNDQFDADWIFERIITDMDIDGRNRRISMTAGKQGFYDINDAETGEYLLSYDMGLQNFILGVDPETDRKIIDMSLYPDGERKMICPHAGGGRSWLPGAYNPVTQMMYVPAVEVCMDLMPTGDGLGSGALSAGYNWMLRPRPESDGLYGHVQAINVSENMSQAWTERQRAPQTTGVLATAGGLVFAGALDRKLTAYDDQTGEPLWDTVLSDVPNTNPITFAVDGKQYIAIVVGYGGAQTASYGRLVPEITLPAAPSSSVWVFELP
ncbi:MAG: hypothetical protein COA71_04355 [SAR86 cluster bacterium]|uniref:Cytochrome c domain-containing protein n=1 Tax=SAR86 cluster bacterium TaxID=2030880 RepID=A0A2A5CG53_9GAMM|nr:MAG: hypothetical protein COA71_04355 [SAR86 cluster bacterium]